MLLLMLSWYHTKNVEVPLSSVDLKKVEEEEKAAQIAAKKREDERRRREMFLNESSDFMSNLETSLATSKNRYSEGRKIKTNLINLLTICLYYLVTSWYLALTEK